jgi:hypothetical protein
MAALAAYIGVTLTVSGMMLVIGGTLAAGLFLPGVVLLAAGMIAFAVAGLLPLFQRAPRR